MKAWAGLLSMVLLGACAVEVDSGGLQSAMQPEGDTTAAALDLPAGLLPEAERPELDPGDPLLEAVGIGPRDRGTWRLAGRTTTDPDAVVDVSELEEPTKQTWMIGNFETGKVVEWEISPDELRSIAEALRYHAEPAPAEVDDDAPDMEIPLAGESDGLVAKALLDKREERSVYSYGTNVAPYRSIGRIPGVGCTATFIGSGSSSTAYIVTAAHCVFYAGSWTTRNNVFIPRRDGCLNPNTGNDWPACPGHQSPRGTSPFGTWTPVDWGAYGSWVYFYSLVNWDEHFAYDVAIVKVKRTSSDGYFPGSLGYNAVHPPFLDGKSKYHQGYPVCTDGRAPANCLDQTLYDNGGWWHIDYPLFWVDGYELIWLTDAIATPGHSGGPFYYKTGSSRYVVAVNSSVEKDQNGNILHGKEKAFDPDWKDFMDVFHD